MYKKQNKKTIIINGKTKVVVGAYICRKKKKKEKKRKEKVGYIIPTMDFYPING